MENLLFKFIALKNIYFFIKNEVEIFLWQHLS